MQSMINYTQNGIMFGGFVGASIFSKNQYVDFLKNERASQFKWHWEAKRELTNRLTRDAIRGALLWGGKSTIVATTFGYVVLIRNNFVFDSTNFISNFPFQSIAQSHTSDTK